MIEAHIDYIMSCSDDEFEHITGVRLPEGAWDKWKEDMSNRTEELQKLFVQAVKAEREACIEAANNALTNEWEGVVDAVEAIRARESNND